MRTVNKVILIGNLTRDPEMKETQNGQVITTFGIATNREWMSNGEQKKSTEFHEIVVWSKLAEICHKYLKKGKLVYLEGYLKTRSWETEEGEKKFKTEIVVQDMIMLEKREASKDEEFIKTGTISKGNVVIGNIEDDYHSLGRKLIGIFLKSSGWTVYDLGNDVLSEEFIEKALETKSRVIGVSAMMYTTAKNIRKLLFRTTAGFFEKSILTRVICSIPAIKTTSEFPVIISIVPMCNADIELAHC